MEVLAIAIGGVRSRGFRAFTIAASVTLVACESNPERRTAGVGTNASVVVGSDTLHSDQIRSYLADALGFTSRGGRVFCSYTILGQEGDQVYLGALCEELTPAATDSLESASGRAGLVALVLDTLARPIRIRGHRVPQDGGGYTRSIGEIFPEHVQARILEDIGEHRQRAEALQRSNRAVAAVYYSQQAGQVKLPPRDPCASVQPQAPPGQRVVRAYYPCEASGSSPGQLYPAVRIVAVEEEPVEAALRQLVRGPTAEERARGFRSHFSDLTSDALLRVIQSPRGDTVTIDFAVDLPQRLPDSPDVKSFLPPGIPAEITWTLFQQFPEVQALRFRLGGDERAFWRWLSGGDSQVYTRRDWERI